MPHDLLIDLPDPTPGNVKALRAAAGLTQRQAAELVGLGDHMRWSEFERGVTVIGAERWALFLLATDQHPRLRIAVRRRSTASEPAPA